MRNRDDVCARMQRAFSDILASQLLFCNNFFNQSIACSYYAVFHAMKAVMEYDGVERKQHKGILSYFNEHYINKGHISSVSARVLHGLFEERNIFTYDTERMASESGAQDAIRQSKIAVGDIINYLNAKGFEFDILDE
ncbi:MAG: HEPN domain-containing protein [Defluviitaleaceae bacterium]|nr:HEPN domain-containing protein [Defluviitaleaceae bacterium]